MTVSVGGSTVVGFSLTNTEIPAGSGVLTVMSFDSVTADTSELTLGMAGAVTSAAGFIYDTDASGSIAHTTDCAGDYYGSAVEDECGVCNGSGPAENFDCDGNCTCRSWIVLASVVEVLQKIVLAYVMVRLLKMSVVFVMAMVQQKTLIVMAIAL